jgi:hypothetical protein
MERSVKKKNSLDSERAYVLKTINRIAPLFENGGGGGGNGGGQLTCFMMMQQQ